MIVTRLLGGLGNQMFQYAAGLALAERRRTVLKLDVSWYREDPRHEGHNRYALGCFNITEQFATREEVSRARAEPLTRVERWSARLARAAHFYRYAAAHERTGHWHRPAGPEFDPGFFDLPDGAYLDGMWQSERFFAPVAPLVRLHFTFRYPPTPPVQEMALRIRESGGAVAVHFRRGDYVRNATLNREIGVIGLDYYHRALAIVREHHPDATLFLFSDDLEWVQREFTPSVPHVFVRATEGWNAYDKIRLMSLCDHAVLSNSTFAWWAAWLNPNPRKLVIAPEPWHADTAIRSGGIVPPEWRRLPRGET